LILLTGFKEYLKCGGIEQKTKRPDSVIYIVYNFNDILNRIIPFLDKNPLLGVKQLDYQDFCKIANMIKEKEHLTEEGKLKICQIKAGMNRGRIIN
jgi:hypothetical protein